MKELNNSTENLNISDVIVRLFNDMASKHNISVDEIEVDEIHRDSRGRYIVFSHVDEEGNYTEIERVYLNEL